MEEVGSVLRIPDSKRMEIDCIGNMYSVSRTRRLKYVWILIGRYNNGYIKNVKLAIDRCLLDVEQFQEVNRTLLNKVYSMRIKTWNTTSIIHLFCLKHLIRLLFGLFIITFLLYGNTCSKLLCNKNIPSNLIRKLLLLELAPGGSTISTRWVLDVNTFVSRCRLDRLTETVREQIDTFVLSTGSTT